MDNKNLEGVRRTAWEIALTRREQLRTIRDLLRDGDEAKALRLVREYCGLPASD